MTDPMIPEGNRNALLALHFHEGDERTEVKTRAHLATCADCRHYVGVLEQVEGSLLGWADEVPPEALRERVLARVARSVRPASKRRPEPSAAPLLGLLPVMAVVVAGLRVLGSQLAGWPLWQHLERWPVTQALGPFGIATLLLLLVGGFGSLALAPVLVLERRRS